MLFWGILLILGILLGNPITILIVLFGMHEDASYDRWQASESNKDYRHAESERNKEYRFYLEEKRKDERHEEYMAEVKRHNKKIESAHKRVRTLARDEKGRFIAQEVIEDFDD